MSKIENSYRYAINRLSEKHGKENVNVLCVERFYLKNIEPLLQNDYGFANDCSITTITSLIAYLTGREDYGNIYDIVTRNIKPRWVSNNLYGTIPLFISRIVNNTVNDLKISGVRCYSRYLKGYGFNYNKIKDILKESNAPIILNIFKANDGYYINHTVLVKGYSVYKDINSGDTVKFLMIYDNWVKRLRYIDYDKLYWISSIDYIKRV